jgi:hypothetical protein
MILECTNFDMGIYEPLFNGAGSYSIQTNYASSTHCLKISKVGAGTGWVLWGKPNLEGNNAGGFGSFLGTPVMCAKASILYTIKPATGREQIGCASTGGGSPKLQFMLNYLGQIEIYDRAGVLQGTTTQVLLPNTDYELQFISGAGTNAPYELFIDGVSVLSGTCDQYVNANDFFIFGSFNNISSEDLEIYYRDIFIADSLIPHKAYIKRAKPKANGVYQDWTAGSGASDYTQVDEDIADLDTTYIQTTGVGNVTSTFKIETPSDISVTDKVVAIKPMVFKRGTGTNPRHLVKLRSSSFEDNTALEYVTNSYHYRGKVIEIDPATSLAWENSAFDNVEVGITEDTAGGISVCTQVAMLYVFIPSSNKKRRLLSSLGVGL